MGHAGRVEIGLEGDVHAVLHGLFQDRARHAVDPFVGYVHGYAAGPVQIDDLLPGPVPPQNLVPQVGGVDTVVLQGHLAQRHQFLEGRVGAGLVVQSQAKAARAGLHPGPGLRLHDLQLVRAGHARLPAHRLDAHGAVRHLGIYVGRRSTGKEVQVGFNRGPVDRFQGIAVGELRVVPEGQSLFRGQSRPAESVRGEQMSRHALAKAAHLVPAAEQGILGMDVHVDEAGADDMAAGVNRPGRLRIRQVSDPRHAAVPQPHVRPVPVGLPGTVDYLTPANDDVEGHSFLLSWSIRQSWSIRRSWSIWPLVYPAVMVLLAVMIFPAALVLSATESGPCIRACPVCPGARGTGRRHGNSDRKSPSRNPSGRGANRVPLRSRRS